MDLMPSRLFSFAGSVLVAGGLASAASVASVACGSFGASDDSPSPTSDAGADGDPSADASSVDAASDDGATAACPAACDTPCGADGVCPPFVFATSWHAGSVALSTPFALAVDDTGVYVGDRGNGGLLGAVFACDSSPLSPPKGARCTPRALVRKDGLQAMAVGPNAVYYATGAPAMMPELGSVSIGGEPGSSQPGLSYADLVLDGSFLVARQSAGTIWRCDTGTLNCQGPAAISSGTSIAAFGGYYCAAGALGGASAVRCAVGTGQPMLVAAEAPAATLDRLFLVDKRAFWQNGPDIHSIDMLGTGAPAAGAQVMILPGAGGGPFAADDVLVYYAVGGELFAATRSGKAMTRSLAKVSSPIVAVAVFKQYVYFAYGTDAGSNVARVAR